MKGIDFSYGKISGKVIKEAGYDFVCRYLSLSPGKNLTKSEYQDLTSVGLLVVVVWETTARRCLEGTDAGRKDATNAMNMLNTITDNANVIYFACDDDFTPNELIAIGNYFEGVRSVLDQNNYKTGVYGGYKTVKSMLDNRMATYAWQTYAWSAHEWDDRAHLRQIQNGVPVLEGVECDTNESITDDFGQF